MKPTLCIVTPALADANNGNWQTAQRWARMLSNHYAVRLAQAWPDDGMVERGTDLLLVLHARRSAPSVRSWTQAKPGCPLVVALTGTDLYRDILTDADAQRSIQLADRLIVLQEQGPLALPEALRAQCRVVFQSTRARTPVVKASRDLRVAMVGHLRGEKRPQTLFDTARLLAPREGIRLQHVGGALDPALGEAALATQRDCPHYHWLGNLPHLKALERIRQAHVLVHTSEMEGGAHVILEAVRCGTPVLASRVPGNVGMLGADYGGYFPLNDAPALAELLRQCRREQRADGGGLLARLQAQCAQRSPLFDPAAEKAALLGVLQELR